MVIENKAVENYKKTLKFMTKFSFPDIKDYEIDEALNYSINKRYINPKCIVDNNYTKEKTDMYLEELTNYILEREPICCPSGVMFKKHGTVPNPLAHMIEMFMDNRGIHKKEMFKYPKGSEMFEKYNLLQLLDKIDCNGIYGVLAQPSALFYNIHVAQSITLSGQSLISSATMFFESFLSNNVKFGSLDEIIQFINNVVNEKNDRLYEDKDLLDKNIDVLDCFAKIVLTIGDFRRGKIKWIPDEKDLEIILDILNRLDQEDINRIYYKNNLYEFMSNSSMKKSIVYILKKLKTPYMDPNEVPEEIKVELETLTDILKEFVYYKYQYLDRRDRCDNMIKNIAALSDTDSAIISLDAWYRFVESMVRDVPMEIKKVYINPVEYLSNNHSFESPVFYEKPEEDYDFFTDEIIETYRLINPVEYIPQDGLRYSIINIMAYIVGVLVNDYMVEYTKCTHSYADNRRCLIYMKNEFLFKRVLLTNNKKNYASIQELQEGNIVPKGEDLDIKGLPIKKSTLNKNTQKALEKILYEDILNTEVIDQIRILKNMALLEKKIYRSLEEGKKDFYKPNVIKALNNYDDPMRIQGIKASVIWNKIKDDDLEAIDLSARNTIDIVKVDITENNVEEIKEEFPDAYKKIKECMEDVEIFKPAKNGKRCTDITSLAIPVDVQVPEWIKCFIDYKTIINDNLANFPIESVNIARLNNDNVNYSTIMKI